MAFVMVRERHPLKQGLKPEHAVRAAIGLWVRERHPLKQGLKLVNLYTVPVSVPPG